MNMHSSIGRNETERLNKIIASLRSENADLREKNRQLQEAYDLEEGLSRITNLTPTEERMLGLLMAREMVPRETMYSHLFCLYSDKDIPEPKILDVFICKLRKKLDLLGCHVETIWGRGWKLDPPSKARLLLLAGKAVKV